MLWKKALAGLEQHNQVARYEMMLALREFSHLRLYDELRDAADELLKAGEPVPTAPMPPPDEAGGASPQQMDDSDSDGGSSDIGAGARPSRRSSGSSGSSSSSVSSAGSSSGSSASSSSLDSDDED